MPEEITFRELTDPHDRAFSASMELYVSSFPADERESLESMESHLGASPAGNNGPIHHQIVAEIDESLIGYTYVQYLSGMQAGFLVYLVVTPQTRNRGFGRSLLDHSISVLKSDAVRMGKPYLGSILEVEREEDAKTDEEREVRRKRLRFFAGARAELVTDSYVQPALSSDKTEVNLNLLWIPNQETYDKVAIVKGFYAEVFGKGENEDLVRRVALSTRPVPR
jgi:GNAT superfamily N-acetyltransferase